MCILFVSSNTNPPPNGYRLVLATNRDEFYTRPAKPAAFWSDTPHILGGVDMEAGKEGGTWIAMNTLNGRIGCLLNITTGQISPDKRGRGRLITNYLNFHGTADEYSHLIHKDANEYNPYNLIMIDLLLEDTPIFFLQNSSLCHSLYGIIQCKLNFKLCNDAVHRDDSKPLTYYSSASQDGPLNLSKPDVHGFGNSLYHTPFAKVRDGRNQLEKLIKCHGTTDQQEELVAGLLDILKCTTKHYPDPQLKLQTAHWSEEVRGGMSSRFVHMSKTPYGTRTHTIILVDRENKVKFMEWTMAEPITGPTPLWIDSKFEVNLGS